MHMKNYVGVLLSWLVLSCSSNSSRIEKGDFVFYRYEVFLGDSLVHTHTPNPEDSAQAFVEDPVNYQGNPFDLALMEQLPKVEPGIPLAFNLEEQYRGRITVLQHIPKRDYPAHIEEGKKRKAAFEAMLELIKADMANQKAVFKQRAPGVADSLTHLSTLLKEGKMPPWQTFKPGLGYIVLKEGSGPRANKSSSWTWVHFCAATPAGEILLNTYESNPLVVNRRGALLAPWIEPSVEQFREGSLILLKVPYRLAFGESANLPLTNTEDIVVLLEILRVNNM
jgi:hypothetical protein